MTGMPGRLGGAAPLRIIAAALLLAGCGAASAPEPPRVGTSQPFRVGTEFQPYADGVLRVTLLSIDSDSRCPSSVACVAAGSAAITLGIRMGMGPTAPLPLVSGVAATAAITPTLRVRFDSLLPYPSVPGPMLPPASYTAWLTFHPIPPG